MEQELTLDEKNALTMKLLHYFITEKNYNPILIQGVDDEIWLENLTEDYKVIRIVSGYIHNKEQLDFDKFKTKKIVSKIKKKTLSLNMNVLSIFLDLSDNVDLTEENTKNIMLVKINDEKDISKNDLLKSIFPDLDKKMEYSEEGIELFSKISNEISIHNQKDAKKVEKVFKMKFPVITYIIISICLIFWVVPVFSNSYDYVINSLATYGPLIRMGEYYRLLTGTILHGSLIHLLINCYSLYVVGSQMESFLGKFKFLFIYICSAISGSLMSIMFAGNNAYSVGASGAIFGLLGSMLYFGYHYRVYLGNVMKSQIIPLILANLAIGFMFQGIDNAAHIGGLIGGILITMALGIDNKSTTSEKVNGWIISAIYYSFLIYMAFVYVV